MSDGGRDGETQITVDEEDAVDDEFDVEDRIVGDDTATSDGSEAAGPGEHSGENKTDGDTGADSGANGDGDTDADLRAATAQQAEASAGTANDEDSSDRTDGKSDDASTTSSDPEREARADATDHEPEESVEGVPFEEVPVGQADELGTDATRLADELGRTQLRTTDEGYVKARVTGLERIDEESVRLLAELPAGGSVSFRLRKPIPWSGEFLLTRLVEDAGYDAATVDHLVGEHVLVERGDPRNHDGRGVWEEGSNSVVAQGRSLLQAIGLADFADTQQRWRLVDPAEVDRGDSERSWLPLLVKLLVGTGVFVACLLALPFLFVLTALSGGGVLALLALLFGLYLAFIAGVLLYVS